MTEAQPPQEPQAAQPVQAPPAAGSPVKPHRGTLVLVLGILGIALCMPLGIVAWVLANSDLKEMQAGLMDRSGEGLTKTGKICGIISVILTCVVLVLVILAVVMGVAANR